jgi:putative mycofactocin binding protein MftB
VTVVRALADHASAREAITAAGIAAAEVPAYEAALARLAATDMIEPRGTEIR